MSAQPGETDAVTTAADTTEAETTAAATTAPATETGQSPETLPPKAWVSLVLFAGFVVAFSSCAGFFLFR